MYGPQGPAHRLLSAREAAHQLSRADDLPLPDSRCARPSALPSGSDGSGRAQRMCPIRHPPSPPYSTIRRTFDALSQHGHCPVCPPERRSATPAAQKSVSLARRFLDCETASGIEYHMQKSSQTNEGQHSNTTADTNDMWDQLTQSARGSNNMDEDSEVLRAKSGSTETEDDYCWNARLRARRLLFVHPLA